jgi:hypothetical protein
MVLSGQLYAVACLHQGREPNGLEAGWAPELICTIVVYSWFIFACIPIKISHVKDWNIYVFIGYI